MQTLPQTSDALRNEARVIREAADRVSGQMEASVEAVRAGHARIRMLEAVIRDTIEALERNSTSAPVVECLKAALCADQQEREIS